MTPVVVIGLPLLGALLCGGIARTRALRLVVAVVIAEVAFLLFGSAASSSLVSPLTLDSAGRVTLAIASLAVLVALAAATDDPAAANLYPAGLAALAGLALVVVTSANLTAAALATVATAVVLVWGLVGFSTAGASLRTVQRYLVWVILAGSALLLSGTFDRLYQQQSIPGVLAPAAALFVVGTGILVAALPFSFWLPALCEEAPISAGLAIGLLSCAMMATLDGTVGTSSFLANDTPLRVVLGAGGGLAAIASTFLALGEKRPGRALAFLVSAGADFALAALASNSSDALAPALWLLGAQALAASLALACLRVAGHASTARDKTGWSALNGLIHRRPLLGFALAVGLLSLAGMPLTAGFVGRWETIETAGWHIGGLAIEMLIASVLGGLAALRSFGSILDSTDQPLEPVRPVDLAAALVAIVLMIGGIYPWPVIALLR